MHLQEAGIKAGFTLNMNDAFLSVNERTSRRERVVGNDFRHQLLNGAVTTFLFRLAAESVFLHGQQLKVLTVIGQQAGITAAILTAQITAHIKGIIDHIAFTQCLTERVYPILLNEMRAENICPRLEWECPGEADHAILSHNSRSRAICSSIPEPATTSAQGKLTIPPAVPTTPFHLLPNVGQRDLNARLRELTLFHGFIKPEYRHGLSNRFGADNLPIPTGMVILGGIEKRITIQWPIRILKFELANNRLQ